MEHTPSMPMNSECGWDYFKQYKPKRKCVFCGDILSESQQNIAMDYYKCFYCGKSSLEYR